MFFDFDFTFPPGLRVSLKENENFEFKFLRRTTNPDVGVSVAGHTLSCFDTKVNVHQMARAAGPVNGAGGGHSLATC